MEQTLVAILAAPFTGAFVIALAARFGPDIRESATLLTAAVMALCAWSLFPGVLSGDRPAARLAEVLPGIELALRVEPLGMLFAMLASGLWIVNSLYSIGYMRANREPRQTIFYVSFAAAIASTTIIPKLSLPVLGAQKTSACW